EPAPQAAEPEEASADSADTTDASTTAGSEQPQPPVKKRRNRWGDAPAAPVDGDSNGATSTENGGSAAEPEKKRRSRWSQAAENVAAGPVGVPTGLPILTAAPTTALSQEKLQQTIVLQMQLKQCNDRLLTVAQDANIRRADPNRSP